MPGGSDGWICSSRSAAARATARLFSPISMKTVPSTISFAVLRRRAGAQLVADLDVRHLRQTHRDACSLRDDDAARKSSMAVTCPGERIRYCAPLRSM